MKHYELIIMAPLFVILMMAIHKPAKATLNCGGMGSWLFSACISALAMIGINHFFKASLETILLPYAAMAIAIFAVLLFAFTDKQHKKTKERPLKRSTKHHPNLKMPNSKDKFLY